MVESTDGGGLYREVKRPGAAIKALTQGNCIKPKQDGLEQKNLHRKGAKALRTQRQAKKTKNHWIAFDFLCENFASFAALHSFQSPLR